MAGESRKTTNHDEIKKWIESRQGVPLVVKDTENDGKGIGVLRIDFQGGEVKDESLVPISWDEFFKTFDEKHLAFLYQDQTESGGESRFF